MTENVHADSPMDAPKPPDAEYGWPDVAREASDWHPDLQVHVDRKLAEHGVERPDRVAVPRLALVTENEPKTPEPTPEPSTKKEAISEIPRNPSEKIVEAFADGQNALLKFSNDPKFHDRCLKEGIDPYSDMDKPTYWRVFRDYAGERMRSLREKMGDSRQISAFELISATPSFIFAAAAVNNGHNNLSKQEAERSKEALSSFNGYIRKMATDFPETKASDVVLGLLNAANTTIEDPGLRRRAEQAIREHVRGAQHEKVFGQILEKTGRPVRDATLKEDMAGKDYVSADSRGRPLNIDVKASLTKIQRRKESSEDAFTRRGDTVVIYSMVKDEELRDTFYIPDELAATKAAALDELLIQASTHKPTYSVG